MNYAISKPAGDGRHNTCSFHIEDGTVCVVDMTRENAVNLERVAAIGYIVSETEKEPGIYTEEDFFEGEDPAAAVAVDVPPQPPAGTRKAPAKKAAKKAAE